MTREDWKAKQRYEQSVRWLAFGVAWEHLSEDSKNFWRWRASKPEVSEVAER